MLMEVLPIIKLSPTSQSLTTSGAIRHDSDLAFCSGIFFLEDIKNIKKVLWQKCSNVCGDENFL